MLVRVESDSEPERVGPVDLVILAVKTYSNREVLPRLRELNHEPKTVAAAAE